MKRIFLILTIIIVLFVVFGGWVKETAKAALSCTGNNASDCKEYCNNPNTLCPPEDQICWCNPLKHESIENLIEGVVDWVFKIAAILAPAMIIIAGVIYITAGGQSQKIALSHKIIVWTIIGFLIVVFAKGLVNLVDYILGVK